MKLPQGFFVSSIKSGIKLNKLDLGLILCPDYAKSVGVFTTNANLAYSVVHTKNNINRKIKAVLVNSGNANCFYGKSGPNDTKKILSQLGEFLNVNDSGILFSSTGIIGKKMPVNKIISSYPKLISGAGQDIKSFASCILTTDTFSKVSYRQLNMKGKNINILGFAKGAGMISPNMATMLGFILTDADLPRTSFKKILKESVERSFNSISVDGCMSTNDAVLSLASGKVKLSSISHVKQFSNKFSEVCLDLAKMIVKDGEGSTKFIEIVVKGAKTKVLAKKAASFIGNSNLFKCAVYGENQNWGRIISALGAAGIEVEENISIKASSLSKPDVKIEVDLKSGKYSWKYYTSDLTPEYVKINADYS